MTDPARAMRRRVIAAVAILAATVLVSVVLALLGHSWWISLAIGCGVFLWLLEPEDGNDYVG